jgi:hypothetical protein
MESSEDIDLNVKIAQSWDALVQSSQKETKDFLATSHTKNLEGSTLFAFFNEKLVSASLRSLEF